MRLWDRLLDQSVYFSFDRSGFLRHQQRFLPGELDVSMAGKVCLVTGGNSGLGFATATALALRRARVIIASRNEERGREACEAIRKQTDHDDVHLEVIDLSSPASIRAAVNRIEQPRIDVLIHNAGLLPLERIITPEGLELTVATHLVGPHLLTRLLSERLAGGRVVVVSSGGMYAKRLAVDAMLSHDREYDGVAAYARTKRGQVVLAELWAARLKSQRTVVHAMHPGWAGTPGVERSLPRFWRSMQNRLRTPEEGADTIVWLAVAERAARSTGRFWFDREPVSTHLVPWTRETSAERTRLWEMCQRYAGA